MSANVGRSAAARRQQAAQLEPAALLDPVSGLRPPIVAGRDAPMNVAESRGAMGGRASSGTRQVQSEIQGSPAARRRSAQC